MKRNAVLFYGILCFISALASMGYLVLFSFGKVVPKQVDSGVAGPVGAALAIDFFLMLLFGLQHSLMARSGFKKWLTRFIPAAAERSTYVLLSTVVTILLIVFWQPIEGTVWAVEAQIPRILLTLAGLLGWGLVVVASLLINPFDLVGLRQVYFFWRGQNPRPVTFKKPLLYRYLRHPMQFGVLLGIWLRPLMSVGHLLFSFSLSVYIVVGIWFEERDLVREFGDSYRRYQEETPRLLPWTKRRTAQTPLGEVHTTKID